MSVPLKIFALRVSNEWLTVAHESYRPTSWPPTDDWVVSEDVEGNFLSRWGDEFWDISPWAGVSKRLDFMLNNEASSEQINLDNSRTLKILITWRIWGIKGAVAVNTILGIFQALKRVVSICNKNNIRATDLTRFPKVIDEIAKVIPKSEFRKTILEFHRLWDAREYIGFHVIDPDGIQRWALAAPDWLPNQTPFIPPRIWNYQVERLKASIDEFLHNVEAFEECYKFCVSAYAHNYRGLQNCFHKVARQKLPFMHTDKPGRGTQSGYVFYGSFHLTAEKFGIAQVISNWTGVPINELDVRNLAGYLSLVQFSCMAYIANFTLQRINEVSNLRTDCLDWEIDEVLGRIPIICGETTKTQTDSDARWVTTPSIEAAVKSISVIARLRMLCSKHHPIVAPSDQDIANPYLYGACSDPWSGGSSSPYIIRPHTPSYSSVLKRCPKLFDVNQLRITEEDHRIAIMLSPHLLNNSNYSVGEIWPLAWHQLRRTVAVNMFASNLLSDSTIQFQMKHASRVMPLYYGRGFTNLNLNEEVEETIISAMYETMAHKIKIAASERFVSPHGSNRKEAILINLVKDKDLQQLSLASRKGKVYFREMKVGACTHRGTCTYGGIESISRCTGGDGGTACADALYDKNKATEIKKEIELIDLEIAVTSQTSPRFTALLAEKKGMENYLNVIEK
jgi:hypothetical protein